MECVIHTTPCPDPTTVASARVARFIAEELGIKLLDGSYQKEDVIKYDRIFYVNSMGAFAKPEFRLFMKVLVAHCRQLIYVQNDYTIHPISQTQKAMRARGWDHDFPFENGPILWTTVPAMMKKPEDRYVNWNRLTYNPHPMLTGANRLSDCIVYWGSYREGRIPSFRKYFEQNLYKVHLSMHPRVLARFAVHDMDNNLVHCKPWKYAGDLGHFPATVYIEDEVQHGQFHSPPNRIYEAMSAGLAVFVDAPCVVTLVQAGFPVNPDWVVNSARDLADKLSRAYEVALAQRSLWGSDHVAKTREELRGAYASLV